MYFEYEGSILHEGNNIQNQVENLLEKDNFILDELHERYSNFKVRLMSMN